MKNKKFFLFPTIKMADLFDMKMGGVGWHFTSHLIALAALFVACFAITGYITFRDESIPDSALKPGADTFDHIEATVSPKLTVGTHNLAIGNLPVGAVVTGVQVITQAVSAGAGAGLDYSIGTAADVDKFVASDQILNAGALVAPYQAVGDGLDASLQAVANHDTDTSRDVIASFVVSTAAITTAGSYKIRVNYVRF